MADKKKKDEKAKEDVSKNPDLEKETEGMVDLSDVLATGDNETGAADATAALKDAEAAEENVDLFAKKEEEVVEVAVVKESKLSKLLSKIFPENSAHVKAMKFVSSKLVASVKNGKAFAKDFKAKSIKFLKEDLKLHIGKAIGVIKNAITSVVTEIKQFMQLSWKLKILFVMVVVLAGLTIVVAKKSIQGKLIPGLKKTYIINFNEVADNIHQVKKKDKWERFRNPMRFPEYVVRFDRLIVMLKPSQFSSRSPMGVFSIYFETSSQEAATEVKFRESEMRDVSARTLEGIAYDDIRNFEGKKRSKKALIQSLNKVLNQGKVINIYFKDFVLKP